MRSTDTLADVVDTDRFPLHTPDGASLRAAVERARGDLRTSGCSVLRGFVRDSAIEALRGECASVAPSAHYDVASVNVYNTDVDADLPDGHPGRVRMDRGNAFVARDRIPERVAIHRLYASPQFRRFLADCVGLPEVHELADPLSGLCLNVVPPGREHPWHFDTNEFAVSLLTQQPDDGGVFEYCPGIRSVAAENLADVDAVLHGRGERLVRRLTLRPGDLQIFLGRYSLHRVTTVRGDTDRHTAIFAYSACPGVTGAAERTRQLFGRVLPEHTAARGERVDQLLI